MFITVEGINGAGKTTMLPYFSDVLGTYFNKQVVSTREPGGTIIGEKLRTLLLENKMSPKATLHLMYAARYAHIEQVIKPALDNGYIVLCDRYYHSTFAFQGQYLPLDELLEESKKFLTPDLTVFLDVPLSVARERLTSKQDHEKDHFDEFTVNAHAASIYHEIIEKGLSPSWLSILNATDQPEVIAANFKSDLEYLKPTNPLYVTASLRSKLL